MALRGWAEAQRYKGGVIKYLYDIVVGEEATDTTISGKVTALETTVGDATGGLVKKTTDIETAIGDEDTANSILGRIKALETAANTSNSDSGET